MVHRLYISVSDLEAFQAMDPNYKCESACREIHSAWSQMSLLGRNLARRGAGERRQIKETYRAMYGEDLVEQLHKAAMADEENEMCTALYLWMLEPHERDAMWAKDAVECRVTDYSAFVEIYTRRRPTQLFFTKQAYLAKFRRHLDQDVITEPTQPYQKILLALSASHKSHQTDLNRHIAKCDAKRLYEAGNCGSNGGAVDESVVLEILSKRSIPQLRMAFSSYKHIYGHEYTTALKRKSCGEFEDSLRVVVSCIYSPSDYYCKMVHKGLQKGDDNRVLTRVIIGGTDVGMKEVRAAFEKRYGRRMEDAICQGLPEGELRDFLIALIHYSADHAS